jgi:hypothetical protein
VSEGPILHVLNLAYNGLCGGDCLQDLERLRNDEGYLDALGTQRIPDPTTAGDFCRRFQSAGQVIGLMEAINSVRAGVRDERIGYLVGTPKHLLKEMEKDLLDKPWEQVHEGMRAPCRNQRKKESCSCWRRAGIGGPRRTRCGGGNSRR